MNKSDDNLNEDTDWYNSHPTSYFLPATHNRPFLCELTISSVSMCMCRCQPIRTQYRFGSRPMRVQNSASTDIFPLNNFILAAVWFTVFGTIYTWLQTGFYNRKIKILRELETFVFHQRKHKQHLSLTDTPPCPLFVFSSSFFYYQLYLCYPSLRPLSDEVGMIGPTLPLLDD